MLLDGLALLLVVEVKHDIVATSMKLESDGIKFLWAKNDPAPADQDFARYLHWLSDNFQRLSDLDDILLGVIGKCKAKVFDRCKKASREWAQAANQILCHNDTS